MYRILRIEGAGSENSNSVFNVISHQTYSDKI